MSNYDYSRRLPDLVCGDAAIFVRLTFALALAHLLQQGTTQRRKQKHKNTNK